MSKTLEVRCCCQPQKLLGWLRVSDCELERRMVHRIVRRPYVVVDYSKLDANPPTEQHHQFHGPDRIELPIEFINPYPAHQAIKAEGMTVEQLQRIDGFVPNTGESDG